MATDWFYKVGDLESGALTEAQLHQMIIQRRIGRETPIRQGRAGGWISAGSVPGLSFPGGDDAIAQQDNTTARKVTCACGKRLTIKDWYVGRTVKCPACGEPILLDISLRQIAAIATLPETSLQSRRQEWSFAAAVIPTILIAGIVWLAFYLPSMSEKRTSKNGDRADDAPGNRKSRKREIANRERRADEKAVGFNEDGGDRRPEPDREQSLKLPDRAADRAVVKQNVVAGKLPNGRPARERKKSGAENAEKVLANLVARGVGQLADLIEIAERCVVRLDVSGEAGDGIGSGFVVDERGTIVTNYHVVAGAKSIQAKFNDGTTMAVDGFLSFVAEKDIAVIRCADRRAAIPFLQVDQKPPRKGDTVVAFGSPQGLSFSASEGIVSGIRSEEDLAVIGIKKSGKWIQTTAPISPGNSGGPLVNLAGKVVGMNTWARIGNASQNLNFAISASDIQAAVKEAEGQKVVAFSPERLPPPRDNNPSPGIPGDAGRIAAGEIHLNKSSLSATETAKLKSLSETVWFGVLWQDISRTDPQVVRQLGSSGGTLVLEVAHRSPAYKAGILKDDVIKSIDGMQATQPSKIEGIIEGLRPGQTVSVVLMRPASNPVRYSRREVKVALESTVPEYAIDHLDKVAAPVEVRDFLARHVLRYAAFLEEAIRSNNELNASPEVGTKSKQNVTMVGSPLTVKELRDKSVFDEAFRPALGRDVPIRVGNIGTMLRPQVFTIINRKMAVLHVPPAFVLLIADTSNLLENESADIEPVQIMGALELARLGNGELFKVFVAKPVAVERYFPEPQTNAKK